MNKYEIILNVCETHSISKTASKLNYTQSAISQAIKSYEKELGFPIFKRSKHGMEPIPGTEDVFTSLRIICQEEEKIQQIASSRANLDSGFIRIGTIQSISYHWLPDILKQFSEVYPNIRFELTVDGFSVLKDHPLSDQITVSLSNINNEHFVLSSDGLDYETGKIFELNNIKPKIQYRLNEDYATIKMVEQGFGVTILPKLLLKDAPFHVCIRSFTEHYSRTLGVAYTNEASLSPATQRFLNYVKEWAETFLP